jgi:hypothetical protein
VYDALVERIHETVDKRETSGRYRSHLFAMVKEHGSTAVQLNVDSLEADIGALPPTLRDVLKLTKDWLDSEPEDFVQLRDVYTVAEARKGARARLASTPDGRSRRLEWANDEHVLAGPLHYRWEQVSTLLNDLAVAE